jgi:hypothetical protein
MMGHPSKHAPVTLGSSLAKSVGGQLFVLGAPDGERKCESSDE